VVATVSEKSEPYGREVAALLRSRGLRIETDFSAEKIGPKKHAARQQKVPYILVIGEQEAANRTVNVNDRDGKLSRNMELESLVTMLSQENQPSYTAS